MIQLAVSCTARFLFKRRYLSPKHDVFHCFQDKEVKKVTGTEEETVFLPDPVCASIDRQS